MRWTRGGNKVVCETRDVILRRLSIEESGTSLGASRLVSFIAAMSSFSKPLSLSTIREEREEIWNRGRACLALYFLIVSLCHFFSCCSYLPRWCWKQCDSAAVLDYVTVVLLPFLIRG